MSRPLTAVTPEQIDRWSYRLIGAGLVFALVLVLLMVWAQPMWSLAVPVVIAGSILVLVLTRRPLVHLCLVLAGFVLTISYSQAVQVTEIAYGLYYLLFLAGWYAYNVFLRGERILESSGDKALVLFFLFAVGSLGLTLVFGGNFGQGFREWLPLTWFGFYFPIKKMCARDSRGPGAFLLVFAWLALFVLVRNLVEYQQILSSADEAWRVMQGRVRMNERILMFGALGSLAFFLHLSRLRVRGVLLGFFLVFSGGIIIGQSRALWVAFALGGLTLFFLVDGRRKIQLLMLAGAGFVGVLLVGTLLFDDLFVLIVHGITDRFASLTTAITSDTSLVNRFYEWGAVLDSIKNTPFLGHGFGVEYEYYSLVYQATAEKSHIHSTYLGLLYRHGLVGLVLVLYFWARHVVSGIQLVRAHELSSLHKALASGATAGLVALSLAATTESILTVSDGVFILVFPTAVIAGLRDRYARRPSSSAVHEPAD